MDSIDKDKKLCSSLLLCSKFKIPVLFPHNSTAELSLTLVGMTGNI